MKDYVVIVPIREGKVLIQKQYKPGAGKDCYGFPAGFVKNNETKLLAAKRELNEETDLSGRFFSIGEFYDNTTLGSRMFRIFFCLVHKGQKISSAKNPDKTELLIKQKWVNITRMPVMVGACMALARELLLSRRDFW